MSQPTLASIKAADRFDLARKLDEVVHDVQVLQGALRGDRPGMNLAEVSTHLIMAKLNLQEVIDWMGAIEGDALAETANA